LAFFTACAESEQTSDRTDPNTSPDLPCDVSAVLEKNCQKCHGPRPVYGAPMPLMTGADMQAGSKSDPTKKVWERMGTRIHDGASPMPPSGRLPAADLAVLDAWLQAGAPRSEAQCGAKGGAIVSPASLTRELPCPEAERTTFRAHADGADAPFEVPEDSGNMTMCFSFKSPWATGTQATAFAPVIDDARVVHHWILYGTSTPQAENGVGRCNMPKDATFLEGWAPGNEGVPLPPDVGLRLPEKDSWLILQIHYWNGARLTDSRDRSGVAMCTTNTPRPHTAITSTLGSLAINLPPRSTNVAITGTCTPQSKEPLHVLGSGPHMHRLGKSVTTEILRGGHESERTSLLDVPNWNFESQTTHPVDLVVYPGDKLVTTCRYDNPSDKRVTYGERTEDEMCFNFVQVWPAPGLENAAQAGLGRCIDP
jgi:hypothetical protein